jgi:DNA-binding GntR family transcriptional regulator
MTSKSTRRIGPWQTDDGTALAARVLRRLRDQIITFELEPYQKISEKSVALELGVSRTPVRESLLRLSEQGLVDVFPQRGTVIAPLRLRDLEKSQFMREALEIALLRRAMKTGDNKQLAKELNAELSVQKVFVETADTKRFYQSDETFHRVIAAHSGLPAIIIEIERSKIHMDRFRHLMLKGLEDLKIILSQHIDLVAAIEASDLAGAERAMQVHLRRILVYTDRAIKLHPEYFEYQAHELENLRRHAASDLG